MLSVENPNVSRAATTGRTDATATALRGGTGRATRSWERHLRRPHGDHPTRRETFPTWVGTSYRIISRITEPKDFRRRAHRPSLRTTNDAELRLVRGPCLRSACVAENCCCSQTQQRAELRRTPSTGAAIAWTEAWPTLQPARTQAVYQNEKRLAKVGWGRARGNTSRTTQAVGKRCYFRSGSPVPTT